LSAAVDPLERLAWVVDFELFRAQLDTVLDRSGCIDTSTECSVRHGLAGATRS
jgi:hypothetical protein